MRRWGKGSRSLFVIVGIWFAASQSAYAEWEDPDINERGNRPPPSKIVSEENSSVSTKINSKADAAEVQRKLPPRGEGKLLSWWSPETYQFSIGYERAGSSTAALGGDNIAFGVWFPGGFGMDFYLGYTRNAGTTNVETRIQETGTTTKSRTTNTQYSGVTGSQNFTAGLGLKGRLYQNSWFQFNMGILFAYTGPSNTESTVGQVTEVIPNTGFPTTKTITEATFSGSPGYGTTISNTKGAFSVGPKIGTEFYPKWFPHLALGFATGVLTTIGGDTVESTTTRVRTVTFIDGVDQGDLSGTDAPTTTTSSTKRGTRVGTFGIGGTTFQFTGIFTIRYVF